ncbi:unnamed protein product [Phytophthora lilii]|uniref:Unnamed protein product n=1 Tax=Phytophthora lilii TaxID=2077276 RepID=A0A9W6XDE9_9STRA|nr:unnamed protein product [Phytophthora lilii]
MWLTVDTANVVGGGGAAAAEQEQRPQDGAQGGQTAGRRQRYEGDNNAQDDDDDFRGSGGFSSDKHSQHEPEQRTRFPPLKTAHGPLSRVSDVRKKISAVSHSAAASPSSGLDWNFDTTVDTPSELDDSDRVGTSLSTPSRDQTKRSSKHLIGPGISIERTFPTKLPSYFATKFRKNQVHALQEENAGLTKENAKLREEIKQLEALNAVLQDDNNNSTLLDDHSESIQFAQRRMRLLQAQNVQLQRQISLLQDALQAQANAETNLMSALNHWRGVIDAGKEEAKQAGADQKAADKQNAASSNNQPIKWMLAIPDKLIEELNRVEGQIHSAANAAHSCYETKLRVSHLSASFLRDDATSLKLSEIYGRQPSSLAHLRIERVKQLEDALARVAGELEKVSSRILEQYPPHASITDPNHVVAYELGKSVRELLLEVSAFGAVVFTPTATVPGLRGTVAEQTEDGRLTALDVVKALSSTSGVAKGPGGAKEREKQAKVMLKQLHARFAGMESHVAMCRREAKYWRTAWQTQDDSLQRLAKRVRGLGQKKVEWCQHYLLAPMTNLAEVFASFQQCYDENSTRQNPYLPLLVETLSMEHPMVQDAIQQWQAYVESVQLKMDELVADYEANRLVLASSLAPPSSLSSPPAQYGHETLPSESEQVPLH